MASTGSHNLDNSSDISTEIIGVNKPIRIENSMQIVTNTKRIKLSSKISVHEAWELGYKMTYVEKWINCLEKISSKECS